MIKSLFVYLCALVFGSNRLIGGTLDLGSPTSHTPYDRYLGQMWNVLQWQSGREPSTWRVQELLLEAREFDYVYSAHPYIPQAPRFTNALRAGDCKAKALWLAAKMHSANVRYVIGKARAFDRLDHAWLWWN